MAKVDDAYTTYDATGNREDLSDIIYNIAPFDTPMITMSGVRSADNILFEWQTESLPNVDATSDLEGFELDREASTAPTRQTNICQIKHKDATVSGTQQKANIAGKKNEMAHQIAKKGKALKRDCEVVLFGTNQAKNLGNATTERTTLGFMNFLVTNVDEAGDTTAPSGTGTALVDGTQRAFTEDMVGDVMQSAYENGGEPSFMVLGPFNKRVASTFEGRANSRHMIAANKVVNSVTMYATDFGDLKILPSRWIRPRDAFLVDPEYVRVAYYRKFTRTPIAKIGDAETEMIVTEFGLQVDNEAAHGVIRDLTTS